MMDDAPQKIEIEIETSIAQEIKRKKELLEKNGFIAVDMEFSDQEVESLKEIKVESELDQFDYYGSADTQLQRNLEQYLKEAGENSGSHISTISHLVTRLSREVMEGLGKESVWVMVRISLPDERYSIPRWHSDGSYFSSSEREYKLVATLKGPQTLFGEVIDGARYQQLSVRMNENYRKNHSDPKIFRAEDLQIRKQLVEVVKPIKLADTSKAVMYLVGDKDAVIHSEPHIDTPRIFISILPGSQSQIEEWRRQQFGE